MTVNDLKINEIAIVEKVEGDRAIRRRMMDMGITKGAKIMITKFSPLSDPIEIMVRDYKVTIRKENAKEIIVKKQ